MLEGIGRFAHARHGFCIVTLCHGVTGCDSFYAFVAVEPQNYSYFKKTYRKGASGDFTAFGRVLLRGDGTNPSKEVIAYVRNKYGIEFGTGHPFIERLVALTNFTASSTLSGSPFPEESAEGRKS